MANKIFIQWFTTLFTYKENKHILYLYNKSFKSHIRLIKTVMQNAMKCCYLINYVLPSINIICSIQSANEYLERTIIRFILRYKYFVTATPILESIPQVSGQPSMSR